MGMVTFYYITKPKGNMPVLPSNHATDEWGTRLYIEAKENGDRRILRSMTAKQRKKWDAIDCDINDYKVKFYQYYSNGQGDSRDKESKVLSMNCPKTNHFHGTTERA